MKSFSEWSIGKKLWTLTGILILNTVVVGGLSLWEGKQLDASIKQIATVTLPAVREMDMTDMLHDGLRAVVYSAIYAGRGSRREAKAEVFSDLQEMTKKMEDTINELQTRPLEKATLAAIAEAKPAVEAYIAEARKIVPLALANRTDEVESELSNFDEKSKALEKKLETLGSLIEDNAKNDGEKAIKVSGDASGIEYFVMGIGIVIGFLLSLQIIRGITKRISGITSSLSEEAKGVGGSARDMAASSQSLAQASSEQASALQETAASIEEMNAMVKRSAENASKSADVSQSSREVALKGKKAVDQMGVAIGEISESNNRILQQVEDSNQKITDIVKVINEIGTKTKVINDIVFQTKLLSFNASVEAARAGEHGKGFAVVAEEVGNLAQMSGNAAKEISDLLESSIERVEGIVTETKTKVGSLITNGKAKVEAGTQITKECAEILDIVVKSVSEVTELVQEISKATDEQSTGINEITKAMNQLDQATHQNATSSQQSATSAGLLTRQANGLLDLVSDIESIVTGERRERDSGEHSGGGSGSAGGGYTKPEKKTNLVQFPKKSASQKAARSMEESDSKVAVGGDSVPSQNDPRFVDV